MNDFREFQKQYNDYLQHGLPYAEDYICHFGILGMKWGVRRYQNPDGTLTPAGKSRYDKLNAKSKEYASKRDETYKKGIKNMSVIDGIRSDYYDKKAESTKKEAKKYGTETPEERDQKTKEYNQKKEVAEKHGFYADEGIGGNFTNKTKDIVIDKDTPLDDNFMKQVDDFNKNYKNHDKIMRDAATKRMAERLGVSENEMKKIIDKNDRPFIYMSDTNGGLYMTADYDLFDGNHVATVEYFPKTKEVYYVMMNG